MTTANQTLNMVYDAIMTAAAHSLKINPTAKDTPKIISNRHSAVIIAHEDNAKETPKIISTQV